MMFDQPEDSADEYHHVLIEELDYLTDHWHGVLYGGMVGQNMEHDPDSVQDRLQEYRSLGTLVEEFVVIAVTVGASVFPGRIHGERGDASVHLQRGLGYGSERIWPMAVEEPENTAINIEGGQVYYFEVGCFKIEVWIF